MPRDQMEQFGVSVMEMTLSLAQAVQEAGGTVYTVEALEKMTVKELILRLATNNIRFVYVGRREKTTKVEQRSSHCQHAIG